MNRFGRRQLHTLDIAPVATLERAPAPAAEIAPDIIAPIEPAALTQKRDLTGSAEAQHPKLRAQVLEMLDIGRIGTMSPDQLRTQIRAVVHGLADRERLQLSARDQDKLAQELAADMVGYGPLEDLLQDERSITEIMINGPDKVFVEIAG